MTNDFVEYWAAARLFVSGGNPYSPAELFKIQQTAGWTEAVPLLMWNPPWTLSFIWPFGLLDHDTGQFLWFLLHTVIIFVGAQWLWQIYDGPTRQLRYAWLAVLTFAPGYFVLLLGQIGSLILLGLIVFLLAAKNRSWSLAGASLTLVSIKPHLLYLLWLAVALWILKERCWRALFGLAAGAVVVLGMPLLLVPEIYSYYAQMFSSGGIIRPLEWATPSLGTIFAELFQIRGMWTRWVPPLAGAGWFFWYWCTHSRGWDWLDRLPLVLLVSVTSTSFVWTFDQIVLLPALIQCAVWLFQRQAFGRHKTLIVLYLAMNAIMLCGKLYIRNDLWYFWAAPAFLVLYLCLRAKIALPAGAASA
jgi:hypothetical protein